MGTFSLDQVRIASPCPVRWEDMASVEGDKVRHCGQCNLHVHNFSKMSTGEVEALIARSSDGLCGGFFRRADGTILTQDCPVGLRAAREKIVRAGRRLFP